MINTSSTNPHDRWQQLATLVDKTQRTGLASLTVEELTSFGKLYRRAASDLSLARAYGLDADAIDFLNRLVGRAYGQLYRAESRGLPSVGKFLREEFPRAVRRNFRFVAVAFALFLLGAALAVGATLADPNNASIFMDTDQLEGLAQRHTTRGGKAPNFIPSAWRPLASGGIMTNNIMVSFIAFAGGIVAGLGTVFILFYNGLHLGVVAAAIHQHGWPVARNFWSFVAPHGVIELPAIFLAAGAGLRLGYALINPGDYARGDALRLAARDAIQLVLGVMVILGVAGLIEGFLSPAPEIPERLKFAFAAVLFTAFVGWLTLGGREPPKRDLPASTPGID